MGFRFRRSIKVGGVRLNVGKQSISASIGPRGASITAGSRGVYSNTGIPGTGISYRKKLGGTSYQRRSNRYKAASPSDPQTTQVAVKFHLDDETGDTYWTDANGQPLSDELIAFARRQAREQILDMLNRESVNFNNKLDALLQLHLETPPPDMEISYTPVRFQTKKPDPPDESKHKVNKPTYPNLNVNNFISRRVGFLGKRVEEGNKKKLDEYHQALSKSEFAQQEMDAELAMDYKEYQENLSQWSKEKDVFEQEQIRLKNFVEVERLTNTQAMQDFLEEHLDSLIWPLETIVSFEISNEGSQVWVDIDLPEIEMMPTKVSKVNRKKFNLTISHLSIAKQQQNYVIHIHSIGFRLIGEIFMALPSVQQIVMSSYSQRISRKTGNIEDEYIYSVKVQRHQWEKINFSRLDVLDVVACFELFDLRRSISKSGIITPIEPFQQ
jgi:hypothetical protein